MAYDYYITQSRLNSLIDLPISLPETDLVPNQWLIVSTLQIANPQAFTFQFLQLAVSSVLNQTVNVDSLNSAPSVNNLYPFPGIPTYVTPGFGLAFVGLYQGFNPLTSPITQAAQEAPVTLQNANNVLPISASRSSVPTTYATPGAYSIVVCNNTTNCLLRLTLLGQLRLNLGLD